MEMRSIVRTVGEAFGSEQWMLNHSADLVSSPCVRVFCAAVCLNKMKRNGFVKSQKR